MNDLYKVFRNFRKYTKIICTFSSGKTAYICISAINNSEGRSLEIPLAFLGDGAFTAEICSDAPDSVENPNHILESQVVLTDRTLTINLASGGGFAAKISPVD